MRAILLTLLFGAPSWAEAPFGIWQVDASRSTFTGDTQPKSFTVRIEAHIKGEVFTLDRIEADGRATSSSTLLYFDNAPREFKDFGCSGTQSSRRIENQAVEIVRNCEKGAWIRLVRHPAEQQQELILHVTEQHTDGRRFGRRLVLQKQQR